MKRLFGGGFQTGEERGVFGGCDAHIYCSQHTSFVPVQHCMDIELEPWKDSALEN